MHNMLCVTDVYLREIINFFSSFAPESELSAALLVSYKWIVVFEHLLCMQWLLVKWDHVCIASRIKTGICSIQKKISSLKGQMEEFHLKKSQVFVSVCADTIMIVLHQASAGISSTTPTSAPCMPGTCRMSLLAKPVPTYCFIARKGSPALLMVSGWEPCFLYIQSWCVQG